MDLDGIRHLLERGDEAAFSLEVIANHERT